MNFEFPSVDQLESYFGQYEFLKYLLDDHLIDIFDLILGHFDEDSRRFLLEFDVKTLQCILQEDECVMRSLPKALRSFIEQSQNISKASLQHLEEPAIIDKKTYQVTQMFQLIRQGRYEQILDVGCGIGKLSQLLVKQNYNTIGIDRNQDLILQARKNCSQGQFACINIDENTSLPHHDLLIALHACSDFGFILCKKFRNKIIEMPCCYQSMRLFPQHISCVSFGSQSEKRSFLNLGTADNSHLKRLTMEEINDIILRRVRRASIQRLIDYFAAKYKLSTSQLIAKRSRIGINFYLEYVEQQVASLGAKAGLVFSPEQISSIIQQNFGKWEDYWDQFQQQHYQTYAIQFLLSSFASRPIELLCIQDRILEIQSKGGVVQTLLLWNQEVSPRNICIVGKTRQ